LGFGIKPNTEDAGTGIIIKKVLKKPCEINGLLFGKIGRQIISLQRQKI
jgi:hypothetical protein